MSQEGFIMFNLIYLFLKFLFLYIFTGIKDIFAHFALIEKENSILKRQTKQRMTFDSSYKLFYCLINKLSAYTKSSFTLVKPETVLKWTRNFISHFWTFPPKKAKVVRQGTPGFIKNLILNMKNSNFFAGVLLK